LIIGVTQARCVSNRKIQLLSGELRLLKSTLDLLHGRFELLLDEIADLQREHDLAGNGVVGEHGRRLHDAPKLGLPGAAAGATADVAVAVEDAPRVPDVPAPTFVEEPLAPAGPPHPMDDPLVCVSITMPLAHEQPEAIASAPTDETPVADAAIVDVLIEPAATIPHAKEPSTHAIALRWDEQPELPPVDEPTIWPASLNPGDSALPAAALLAASAQSGAVIAAPARPAPAPAPRTAVVLFRPSAPAPVPKLQTTLRTVARWAAVLVLCVVAALLAAAGTGIAGFADMIPRGSH
jgi:hypothetical protein